MKTVRKPQRTKDITTKIIIETSWPQPPTMTDVTSVGSDAVCL